MITTPDPYTVISVKSHDLATPLTTIAGTLSYLDTKFNQESRERKWITILKDETQKMTSIVRELLLYSALERKKLQFTFKNVELIGLLESTQAKIQRLYPHVPVSMKYLEKQRLINIIGDQEKLEQAFLYIFLSAYKEHIVPQELSIIVRMRLTRIIIGITSKYMSEVSIKPDPAKLDLALYLGTKIIKLHKGYVTLDETKSARRSLTVMLTSVKQKGGYV